MTENNNLLKELSKFRDEVKFQIKKWLFKNVSFCTYGIYIKNESVIISLDTEMEEEVLQNIQKEFNLRLSKKETVITEEYHYINSNTHLLTDKRIKYSFKIRG